MTTPPQRPHVFGRIVVGITPEGGADALALARTLAAPGAEIVAVMVSPTILGEPRTPDAAIDADIADETDLRTRLDALDLDGATDREIVLARTAAAGLQHVAAHRAADLVVIGSSRRGLVGRILDGDDTRGTLRTVTVPVAVAPRGHADVPRDIGLIAVGWDATPQANRALDLARDVGRALGAPVEVVTITGSSSWTEPAPRVLTTAPPGPGDTLTLPDDAVPLHASGPASDVLGQIASEVDLLVLGSPQRARIARLTRGATTENVAGHAPVPVLAVP